MHKWEKSFEQRCHCSSARTFLQLPCPAVCLPLAAWQCRLLHLPHLLIVRLASPALPAVGTATATLNTCRATAGKSIVACQSVAEGLGSFMLLCYLSYNLQKDVLPAQRSLRARLAQI
jgi:predicted transporter